MDTVLCEARQRIVSFAKGRRFLWFCIGIVFGVKRLSKVKFYNWSVRKRLIPILKLIDENYPTKVAKVLRMSRQHMHYYLKKLEKAGLVKRTGPRWPAFYETTEQCKKFLSGCEGLTPSFVFRLHNCVFKYPILQDSAMLGDWRKVEKMNWSSLIGSELGLTVEQTTRHVLVYCDVVEGRDPSELLLLAKDAADRVAAHLRLKYGIRLGEGSLARKVHFGVYDPVAALFSRYWQVSDDVAKVDESEGFGEVDWLSVEAAKDYLLMPQNVKRLIQIQEKFANAMNEHLRLIEALQALTQKMDKVIEKLSSKVNSEETST
ncbi:MAG: winged helix-turn-helix domain-containing protein [Candidatus Bathyarchaeia archaeon]